MAVCSAKGIKRPSCSTVIAPDFSVVRQSASACGLLENFAVVAPVADYQLPPIVLCCLVRPTFPPTEKNLYVVPIFF